MQDNQLKTNNTFDTLLGSDSHMHMLQDRVDELASGIDTTTNNSSKNIIPETWQKWVKDNLENNVKPEHLEQTMLKAGFSLAPVRALVTNTWQKVLTAKHASGALASAQIPAERSLGQNNDQAQTTSNTHLKASTLTGDWQNWLDVNLKNGVIERVLIDTATNSIKLARTKHEAAIRAQQEAIEYTYEAPMANFDRSIQTQDRQIPVLLTLDKPRIAVLGDVLSQQECEELIAMARPRMAPSTITDGSTAKQITSKIRSSDGAWFHRADNPLIQRIEQRIAKITNWPIEKGEGILVQRYQDGGQYVPHYDFFPPENATSPLSLVHGGQRVATLIVYLNTVEQSGETIFPKLNLKVKAVQGQGLYFAYTNSKGENDRQTFHGGQPVPVGEKWIMTKWMRQHAFA